MNPVNMIRNRSGVKLVIGPIRFRYTTVLKRVSKHQKSMDQSEVTDCSDLCQSAVE